MVLEGLTARACQTLGDLTAAASERSGNFGVCRITAREHVHRCELNRLSFGVKKA